MTRTPTTGRLWAAHRVAAVLLVAAVVVAAVAVGKAWPDDSGRVDVGSSTTLDSAFYGRAGTVQLPFSRVDVMVGDPVESLDHGLVAYEYDDPRADGETPLRAPDGGSLVPVSWSVRATTDLGPDGDTRPVTIALARGDEEVELTEVLLSSRSASDAFDPEPVAIGFSAAVDSEPVRVEVTYDGVTQSLDAASGAVDSGLAAPLYEPDLVVDLGCADVDDQCSFEAADPAAALRPYRSTFTARGVSFFPYSSVEGWAEEGTLWASVYVQTFGNDVLYDAGGRTWSPRSQTRPRATLGGVESVRNELGGSTQGSVGFIVFAVDADSVDEIDTFRLEQRVTLPSGAPQDSVLLRADLPVERR